jgi:hypothetical protein
MERNEFLQSHLNVGNANLKEFQAEKKKIPNGSLINDDDVSLIKNLDFENMRPETMKLLNNFVHGDKNEQEFGAKIGVEPPFPHKCKLKVNHKIGIGELVGSLVPNLKGA